MIGDHEYLRRIPKVDLHCHIAGALRPATLAELAAKNGLALPRPPAQLYGLSAFLRDHGADTVSVVSLDYVMDRENPLYAKLQAFLRG